MIQEKRNCQNCKNAFTIEPDDFDFYKKIDVPPPTWCPMCRFQRRIAFRNERKIFWAESALSGKKVLSLYSPTRGFTIYDDDEWRSDAWDPFTYGRDVDFTRPFLEQVRELSQVVPKAAAARLNMVRSEYSGNAADLKNCYLMFNSNYDEDCAYGNGVDFSFTCFDNSHIQKCEQCYNSFWLTGCSHTHFSSRCEDCHHVWFSRDCRGCSDCFGCVNLRLKKYCIFNVQYDKDGYQKRIAAMRLSTQSGLASAEHEAYKFWNAHPYKYMQGTQNTRVSGEYVTHSKNVFNGYLIRGGEDIRYSQYLQVPFGKDVVDASVFGDSAELFYEDSVCGWGAHNIKFCLEVWSGVHDLEYCMFCQHSSDLFGCIGMRGGQYCILNTRYAKEEYEALVKKIKTHMNDMPYVDTLGRVYRYGEFFPADFSPVPYNHSIAPEHFPLKKEEAVKQGFLWEDPSAKEYQITMRADDLPDALNEITDVICKEVLQCLDCKKGYRIISEELEFLRREGIPVPRLCVDCRHAKRISQRNRNYLYGRTCCCDGVVFKNASVHPSHTSGRCPNVFETSYAPDRSEIVYCENCYQAEVA